MELPGIYEHLTNNLGQMFEDEVKRLQASGAVNESTSHSTIIRVAIENIAENWHKGNSRTYNNLKRF